MRLPDTARAGAGALVAVLAVAGLVVGFVGLRFGVAPGGDDLWQPGTSEHAPGAQPPTPDEPATEGSVVSTVGSPPIRLEIPAIGTSAEVVPVRLAGAVLVPPRDVRRVGWWAGGARVGDERGTVLLAGHSFSGGDGVFDHLGSLGPGDRITVLTTRETVVYLVSVVLEFSPPQLAAAAPQLFGQDGPSRLVLATCGGYDGSRYNTTIVVIAGRA